MKDVGDLELEELERVDMKYVQCYCEARITVPNKHVRQPCKVRTALDSGAGVSCISERMRAELAVPFERTQIVHPMHRAARARVADGLELAIIAIEQQTCRVSVTIVTPCHPPEM